MTRAIQHIRARGLRTAALTNNWADEQLRSSPNGIRESGLFDVIVESAVEGLRKPDPRIYALALARLEVLASEAVFLDDLGMNLKPARDMGMATIKVVDPTDALAELGALLGLNLEEH
jgi:putative hydrolase of the HAD superfamily